MMYDFIGDIHGHAGKLLKLLELLGYKYSHGVYQHPNRKAFFLGDLIDGGPKIAEVLNIVIPMVNNNLAGMIMGNHEYNFLSYQTPHPSGQGFLRSRSENHTRQCQQTLQQLSDSEISKLLAFIWQIPLWYRAASFQAIHACWDEAYISLLEKLASNDKLNLDLLVSSNQKDSQSYQAIEIILKGHEVEVPSELHFSDNYGKVRSNARVCWWNEERKIIIPSKAVDTETVNKYKHAIQTQKITIQKPTFFGHYWETGTPTIINPKAVCLDYSVAKGHYLCAYRFGGEDQLEESNLIYV